MTDPWAALADPFVEGAYATPKGRVRTFVLHQQLLAHLPPPPASIVDIGGGAGNQSLPLARLGYDVTIVDPSDAMLAKAAQRVAAESESVQSRVHLVQSSGETAPETLGGRRFDGVLCHGVLMYLPDPAPMVASLGRLVTSGGIVSIMALNAATMAVRPALAGHWEDALAAFDQTTEVGVLGVPTRADTVDGLSALLRTEGIAPEQWYGVWLFCDWMAMPDDTDVDALAKVELEAARRDPYRQLSRVFHLVGRASQA